jgi:hypothetical protein
LRCPRWASPRKISFTSSGKSSTVMRPLFDMGHRTSAAPANAVSATHVA